MRQFALLLSVASCSVDPSSQAAAMNTPILIGEWQIVTVNGEALAIGFDGRASTLTFDANGYGGYAGCNSFGGQGLEHEGRFYGGYATSTEIGCGAPLAEQETTVQRILGGGPKIDEIGPKRVALKTSGHRMELIRLGPAPANRPVKPPTMLIGTYTTFGALDGKPIEMPGSTTGPVLIVEGDHFTFETPCIVVEGDWAQNGTNTVTLTPKLSETRACNISSQAQSEAWTAAMQGALRYVIGPNNETLIAGRGHWMAGDLSRRGRNEATLLTGRYRIEDGRKASQLNGTRPPELILTRNAYYLWDGCNHTEGLAIMFERQLFLHGIGLSTLANCKAEGRYGSFKDILQSEPRIGLTTEGVRLASPVGSLRLRRVGDAIETRGVTSSLASGMRFSLLSEGGGTLEILPGNRFLLTQSCGVTEGRWRNAAGEVDGAIRFGPDRPIDRCLSDEGAKRVQRAFNGNLDVTISPNGDIALFAGQFGAIPARLERQ